MVVADMPGGGELTVAAMDEYDRMEIGRKTFRFVRRVMDNPMYRQMIQARAAEIRASREATGGQPIGCGE